MRKRQLRSAFGRAWYGLAAIGAALVLASCGSSSVGGLLPSPTAEVADTGGHAAGEPTDAQVKLAIQHKDCLNAPDPGTHAACISVDAYNFGAIGRHGRLCQVVNRLQVPSYPITVAVTATGHFQDSVDRTFSMPPTGVSTAQAALMFNYSAYYQAWNYNVAPLSTASACAIS